MEITSKLMLGKLMEGNVTTNEWKKMNVIGIGVGEVIPLIDGKEETIMIPPIILDNVGIGPPILDDLLMLEISWGLLK
jgi:hypothetical protein